METNQKILSEITIFSKYARYIPELKRRETWDEIIDRYIKMLYTKFPYLKAEIKSKALYIREKKVLPSMRALQFSGKAAEVNNSRIFNCSYLPITDVKSFSEVMFLLLGGTGVGYSVQIHHIEKLPSIKKPKKPRKYVIEDSIMGWAEAVRVLMKAYLEGTFLPIFDFSSIRPKGERLITAGGKAPGPEPLKICLTHIQAILERKKVGEKLTSLECHDILCHIANSVLAGGIRRSALISLFSLYDEDMITCKYGSWWELNEQRGRANNSAVLKRGEVSKEEFFELWKRIEASNSGEPGIFWTNDYEVGTNPCSEIALYPYQFCNLCEINVSDVDNQEEFEKRVEVASFFGTLQASFTNFHYLREQWALQTEKESLLGIGMTGIASAKFLNLDLKRGAEVAVKTNEYWSKIIGINKAARVTCVKPSGTTSLVLGTSSGVHAWYSKYYLRTIRFNKNEALAKYLMENCPEICEDDILKPHDTVCVRIPVKAPENSILRYETAIETLERVKYIHENWIKFGHISGQNTHNVSVTVFIDKNRKYIRKNGTFVLDENGSYDEWQAVGEWMWENKDCYNGISVLPYDNGSYKQAPFEEITKEEYERRSQYLKDIDLSNVIEDDDNINFSTLAACSGSQCEIV